MLKISCVLKCLSILLSVVIHCSLVANNATIIESTSPTDYKLEYLSQRYVVGLPVVTSNEGGRFQKDVPPLWERFFREKMAEKIQNRLDSSIWAVYTDYQSDFTKPFTYLIGCRVSDLKTIPPGMIGVEIAPSAYAVFTARGQFPQSLAQTWQAIWNSNLKRAYTTDFELYPPDFNPKEKSEIKIYISIK
jgi:predicted transcriptional regulator YdeE